MSPATGCHFPFGERRKEHLAIEDLVAGMTLGRHVSQRGIMKPVK
jgi:hypothetical protein